MCVAKNGYQKRILIIDDDIDLLMLLERRLQKEGYEIETAVSLQGLGGFFGYNFKRDLKNLKRS